VDASATPHATSIAWIAPARDAEDRRALEEWARARGVRLVAPVEGHAPELPVDVSVGGRVEDELERAREAIAAQETDAAERALARAEEALRAHPELPHAAWLMAEVHRGWSARWHRLEPRDSARGDAAWQRADALDGGRVAGIGEAAAAGAPPVQAWLDVDDAAMDPADATLRVDGVITAPGELARPPGEHAIALIERGAVRWAAWVALADGSRVRVRAPSAPACSTGDIGRARARLEADAVMARGVRCAAWIAVMPGPSGALRIASCEASACGPLVQWRVGGVTDARSAGGIGLSSAASERPSGRWPVWATAAIVVAGVAAATTAVLAATGAFESEKSERRFVSGGLKVQSF
jgi:hypothetical protein